MLDMAFYIVTYVLAFGVGIAITIVLLAFAVPLVIKLMQLFADWIGVD